MSVCQKHYDVLRAENERLLAALKQIQIAYGHAAFGSCREYIEDVLYPRIRDA